MEKVHSQTNLPYGKTIIDEYIDSLIQNTFEGTQIWHLDKSDKDLRYYYDTGQGVRIYIMQESIAKETETFSLRMAYGANFSGNMLIASEYSLYDYPNQLCELWTVVQENTSKEEESDFNLISYINGYLSETNQKNIFNELCRILVTTSEDIIELFKTQ
jgi:hypothetical protein